MRKFTKIVSVLLLAAALGALLGACGSAAKKDVPVAELTAAVSRAISADPEKMVDPGENYVHGYLKKTADEIGEYAIRKTAVGTSIDEFGIFKAGKLTTAELKTAIEGYLQILRDSWMNYQPEEKPKLDGAEIRVVGDYVIYAILSEADREAAFAAFENELK